MDAFSNPREVNAGNRIVLRMRIDTDRSPSALSRAAGLFVARDHNPVC